MSEILVKQLVWSEPSPPKEGVCYYDHCDAETPFGFYRIEWKSWKDYPGFTIEAPWGFIGTEDTLEDAKRAAQDDLEAKIIASIFEDIPSLPLTPEASTPAAITPPSVAAGTNSEAQP